MEEDVMHAYDFVDELAEALKEQLVADEERWGNTWLQRTRKGQTARTVPWLNDYFDQFEHGGVPVPWLKVIGGVMINWLREKHPELSGTWAALDGPGQ